MKKEERKQYFKEYYKNNKEKIRERQKEYYEKNEEKFKKYREDNKEYHKNVVTASYAETSYAPKHKQLWTEAEIVRIINPKMTLKELAKEIGRSEESINAKRVRLKKLGYKVYKFKK